MVALNEVTAWRPSVPGVQEVFHARFTEHAYPPHTHNGWTLLIVDDGMVKYGLDRHEHAAVRTRVTLLPPDVPHDGRPAGPEGFRKRVLYLERGVLEDRLIGAAVDAPTLADSLLRHRIHQLHEVLTSRTEDLEAHTRLVLITERLSHHLGAEARTPNNATNGAGVAAALRELLDSRVQQGVSLGEAAEILEHHPAHLVRAFRREYALAPHQYLTARRVDLARRLLLGGHPPALAATLAGFYDQSHLTRHFRRTLGISPGHYARSGGSHTAPS